MKSRPKVVISGNSFRMLITIDYTVSDASCIGGLFDEIRLIANVLTLYARITDTLCAFADNLCAN